MPGFIARDCQINARVTPEMRVKLEELAKARGETISTILRSAIYEFVRAHKREIASSPFTEK